jgi:inner membrane protein
MLFFGHIGITTGIIGICQELLTSKVNYNDTANPCPQRKKSTFICTVRDMAKSLDYRFIVLGSLLPDIIDKPIWLFSGSNFQWDGRGYAHSFLFILVLFFAGLMQIIFSKRTWIIYIWAGCVFHLVLDQIWLNPTTIWWPVEGPIQRGITKGWFAALLHDLVSNPYVYAGEILGFTITFYIALRLITKKKVIHFMKTGDLIGITRTRQVSQNSRT